MHLVILLSRACIIFTLLSLCYFKFLHSIKIRQSWEARYAKHSNRAIWPSKLIMWQWMYRYTSCHLWSQIRECSSWFVKSLKVRNFKSLFFCHGQEVMMLLLTLIRYSKLICYFIMQNKHFALLNVCLVRSVRDIIFF